MIKVTGDSLTIKLLKKAGIDIEAAIKDAVFQTAQQVRSTAAKSISSVSNGNQVQRSRQGGNGTYTHTASAPFDAPNTDTGALVKSLAVEPKVKQLAMFVGSNLDYAAHLEFGTRNMDERPWLYPALNANEGNLQRNVSRHVKRLLK